MVVPNAALSMDEQLIEQGWSRSSRYITSHVALAFALLMAAVEFHLGFIHRLTEIDDGVYFGEGVLLAHGVVPYRSYIDVQPPGIALVMAPFGLLARLSSERLAFEVARLFVMTVGIVNVGLLGRLVRRRHWFGVLVALIALAFYLDTIVADHTILLEPFLVFGTLLGFVIIFDDGETATFSASRWLAAGAVIGLTTSIKIWEVLPLIVLLFFASRRGRRCFVSFCVGAVGGAALICAPFFVMAPGKFFHEVIVVQVTRSRLDQVGEKSRLWNLLGAVVPQHISRSPLLWIPVALCIIAALAYLVSRFARRCHSRFVITNLDVCALACLILVGLSFLVTGKYDSHYGGFFAPFFALILSSVAVLLLPLAKPAVKLCVAIALLFYFAVSDRSYLGTKYPSVPTETLDRTFSPTACVQSQVYSPLLLSNRYNLFTTDCPHAVDIYGVELTDGNGLANFPSDARAPELQAAWLRWLHGAEGVVLYSPPAKDPNLGTTTLRYFAHNFSLRSHVDGLYIYKRS